MRCCRNRIRQTLSPLLFFCGIFNSLLLSAGDNINSISFSVDLTITVDTTGQIILSDEQVAEDNLSGSISVQLSELQLPKSVALDGLYIANNGDVLFSTETAVELEGKVFRANDIIRFNGNSNSTDKYELEFDAAREGLPNNANVDAIGKLNSDWVLSFANTVQLSGMSFFDEDLVLYDGSTFSPLLTGRTEGIARNQDIDAVAIGDNGRILVSFAESGIIEQEPNIHFADEDILEYDRIAKIWRPFPYSLNNNSALRVADLVALAVQDANIFIFKDNFDN